MREAGLPNILYYCRILKLFLNNAHLPQIEPSDFGFRFVVLFFLFVCLFFCSSFVFVFSFFFGENLKYVTIT